MSDDEKPVDARGKLEEEPFDYQITKDGRVLVYWNGKHVTTVAGKQAAQLIAKLETADDEAVQLLLAKVTGNFKRGNERSDKPD